MSLPLDNTGLLRACKLAEEYLAHAVADRLKLGCVMAVHNALRVLREAIAEAEGGTDEV